MRRALTVLAFSLGAFLARPASATTCTIPYTFSNGTAAQAAQVNSNFTSLQSCANNIDFNNIGTSGIYASQIIPGSSAQATFGGSQPYTLPNALTVNGTLNNGAITTTQADGEWAFVFTSDGGVAHSAIGVNTGSGFYYYALAKLDTANNFQAWLMGIDGGGNLIIPNGGVQAQGGITGTTFAASSSINSASFISQTRSGTAYGVPYDAQSTSGSLNMHLEHGDLAVASFSLGSLNCNSPYNVTYAKAYTAAPTVILSTTAIGSRGQFTTAHLLSSSTTGFVAEICNPTSTAENTPGFLSWHALGE